MFIMSFSILKIKLIVVLTFSSVSKYLLFNHHFESFSYSKGYRNPTVYGKNKYKFISSTL